MIAGQGDAVDMSVRLRDRCHINKNDAGDRFVGIQVDAEQARVCFPVGYRLPGTEQEIRRDIWHLIAVLAEFTDRSEQILTADRSGTPQSADFPIHAYLEVINCYLEQNSYYTEREPLFRTSGHGRIDWAKTIRKQHPLIQSDGSPVYTEYTVRASTPNDKNLITQIHKYCVYESFQMLGWLFTSWLPPRPTMEKNTKMFLSVLHDKLAKTNNDREKRLFAAMIAILQDLDGREEHKQFSFGTESFEYVWEKLIDRVYGVRDKYRYFPRTRWYLKGSVKENYALEPDSVMQHDGKIYVLDAKYYRYGITGNPMHLPESSSINKQITYGEYIYMQERLKRKDGMDTPVYNAFLMPYNSAENRFGSDSVYGNIGQAKGDWKAGKHDYEKVQGIVVDTRYLMYHYTGDHKSEILQLADAIERALRENNG